MSTSALQGAERAARRLYASPGLRNAYVDGARASLGGRTAQACPYKGTAGWAHTWRLAWLRGHRSVQQPSDEQVG